MTDLEDGEWVEVGHCAVDAGCLMIMDPSYAFVGERYDDTVAGDWSDTKAKQLVFPQGHAGMGVLVNSGFGDGYYPVQVRYVDILGWGRRVAEVRVVFISDESDDLSLPPVPERR